MEPIGLYIHVPFCTQKCPYCDFYSLTDTKQMNGYTNCIINKLYTYRKAVDRATEKVSLEEGVYGRTRGSLLSVGMRRSVGDSEKPTESITCRKTRYSNRSG